MSLVEYKIIYENPFVDANELLCTLEIINDEGEDALYFVEGIQATYDRDDCLLLRFDSSTD